MLSGALALLVAQAICDLSLPNYMSDIVDTGVLNGNVNYHRANRHQDDTNNLT